MIKLYYCDMFVGSDGYRSKIGISVYRHAGARLVTNVK